MGLKLKLKPGERVFINGALLRNGPATSSMEVLNKVPLLREKDILLEKEAKTSCQRLYFIVQMLYFDPADKEEVFRSFSRLATDILKAAPSTNALMEKIYAQVSSGKYYSALREIRKLIEYESELLEHAKRQS